MATPKEKTVEEVAMGTLGAVVMAEPVDISPAIGAETYDDFFEDIIFTSSDFKIPRMQLMQGTSKPVKRGEAFVGEYRDGTEIIAKNNEDFEVIVVKLDKFWSIQERNLDGTWKEGGVWRREEFSLSNEKRPWRFVEDGKNLAAFLTIAVYLLRANENGEEVFKQMPKILTLQSTSYTYSFKELNKIVQGMKLEGKAVNSHVLVLGRKETTKSLVPTFKLGRATTASEQECSTYWRNELKTHKGEASGEEA